jgi:3-methyladenine DNA glycosylase AlkD
VTLPGGSPQAAEPERRREEAVVGSVSSDEVQDASIVPALDPAREFTGVSMTASRGTQRAVTPRALAAESHTRLAAAADALVAARSRSYFKEGETVAFYGLKTPDLRQIERELSRRVEPHWTLQDAVAFCDVMLVAPQLEAKGLGLLLLARYSRSFSPGLLRTAKSWLARGRCANWATTDGLSLLIIAPILCGWPTSTRTVAGWARSRGLWVRRAAAVALIPMVRRGEALAVAYGVAAALLEDDADLIHKATGWLLREAGKTDPVRLERFLLAQGPRLPRTALRYAIERFPVARRRRLMAWTSVSRPTAARRRRRAPRPARAASRHRQGLVRARRADRSRRRR